MNKKLQQLTRLSVLLPALLSMGLSTAHAIPGDINGDNLVNALDLRLLQMRRLGLRIPMNGEDPDVNGSGTVDATDFGLLARGISGMPVVFSAAPSQTPGNISITGLNLTLNSMVDTVTINGTPVDLSLATPITEVDAMGQTIVTGFEFPTPAGAQDGPGVINIGGQTTMLPVIRVPVQVSVSAGTESEESSITITATLDKPAADDITVGVVSADGTAIAGQDYTSVNQTITIAAGSLSGTTSVSVNDDDEVEDAETFTVTLRSPMRIINNTPSAESVSLGTPITATATILDNERVEPDFADFDGDGFGDTIVCTTAGRGRVVVVYGSGVENSRRTGAFELKTLLSTNQAVAFDGSRSGNGVGKSVVTGDVDGDGLVDLIVGAPGIDSGSVRSAGAVFVIYGRSQRDGGRYTGRIELDSFIAQNPSAGLKISGTAEFDNTGDRVICGDFDGDNIADFAIGTPNADRDQVDSVGQICVIYGQGGPGGRLSGSLQLADLPMSHPGQTLILNGPDVSFVRLSQQMSFADVDGDRISDLVIGLSGTSPNQLNRAGSISVIYGQSATGQGRLTGVRELSSLAAANLSSGFVINGSLENAGIGNELAVGDFDGDRATDLIFNNYDGMNRTIQVVYGKGVAEGRYEGEVSLQDLTMQGSQASLLITTSTVSGSFSMFYGSGDLDGDRVDEIIISATRASPTQETSSAGQVYCIYGRSQSTGGRRTGTFGLDTLDSRNSDQGLVLSNDVRFENLGTSVATGDIDADGTQDLIIGSIFAAPDNKEEAGQVFVVYGQSMTNGGRLTGFINPRNTTSQSGGFSVAGGGFSDKLGEAIATGDFDGDGLEDVAMTSHDTGRNSAVVYVFYGSSGQLPSSPLQLSEFKENNATKGMAVEGIANDFDDVSLAFGDLDGDNCDDLIIGAEYSPRSEGTFYDGRVFVIYGRGANNGGRRTGTVVADTVAATNEGARFDSMSDRDRLGTAVACADFDNDGFDDLMVSAILGGFGDIGGSNDRREAGFCYVVYGQAARRTGNQDIDALTAENSATGLRIVGESPFDRFGHEVYSGADFDGDGIQDLLCVTHQTGSFNDIGTAYIFYGSSTATGGRLTGHFDSTTLRTTNSSIGFVVDGTFSAPLRQTSGFGDFDNDGKSDLLLATSSSFGSQTFTEEVAIIYGRGVSDGGRFGGEFTLDTLKMNHAANVYSIVGDENQRLGVTALTGADLDNDNADDIIIGSGFSSIFSPNGQVIVIYGQSTANGGRRTGSINANTIPTALANDHMIFTGAILGDRLGDQIAISDIDGDSRPDLVFAQPDADPQNRPDAGQIDIIFNQTAITGSRVTGSIDLSQPPAQFKQLTIEGETGSDKLGSAVAGRKD